MSRNKFIKNTSVFFALLIACLFGSCSGNKPEASENGSVQSEKSTVIESSVDSNGEKTKSSVEENEQSENSEEDEGYIPEISDPTPDSEGETVNGIFVYNDVAYELFYGSEGMAKYYAETISDIKTALGDGIKVYNVVVPTHVGIDLPAKFDDLCEPQDEYLNTIVTSYTSDVIGVNVYDKLMHHRNEYLYFNSDHHWTALAAYYAYEEFAKAAGIEPIKLSELTENKIDGYTGSLAYATELETLKEDYVTYYTSDDDIDCTKYDEDGENPEDYMLIHDYASGVNSYGVFLGGDTPLLVTNNKDGNGKKIAVVKESYGNAFSPFIAYTYSEAHFIDFRYINFDFKSYLEENGIDEVIFINNSMASATDARCEELSNLVKS